MKFFRTKKPLKILFIGSEAAPFAKVGGLASVMYSLPKALSRLGHDARVMIPRYLSIDPTQYELSMVREHLKVPTKNEKGESHLICNVKLFTPKKDEDPVCTYFLENQEYYEQRANVYGYMDDPVRWLLLCRGALEFLQTSDWKPDIIVGADWQTGYISNLLRTEYKNSTVLSKVTSVLAIHNMYHQGMFDHKFVQEMDYDDGHSMLPALEDPRLNKINALRRGIMHSDAIVTVSPNYAKEILTKEYGEMLDELLRERRAVLTGILNGIDYDLWNPENDPYVAHHFDKNNLEARTKNKKELQERFRLNVDKDAFIVSIVSRLTRQKGFDLLYPIMDTLMRELPIQFVVLGEGEGDLMGFFHDLETRYAGRVATHLKYDPVLPHIVLAGTDAVLVPSRFEPCGLTQLEAMRMGAIPIARKTGGIADSVIDYNPNKEIGTGFVFENFDSSSLMIAFIRAFENHRSKKQWQELQKRAMEEDFSWDSSAKKYTEFFERAIVFHNRNQQK
ncbi:MAG: glycogen/starch synthase [Patescibacteria group bacterium]